MTIDKQKKSSEQQTMDVRWSVKQMKKPHLIIGQTKIAQSARMGCLMIGLRPNHWTNKNGHA